MLYSYDKKKTFFSELFKISYNLKKKKIVSGGSRSSFYLKKNKNIILSKIHKKLNYKFVNKSGRNCLGSVILRTKKSLNVKKRSFTVNYSFRQKNIGFIGSILLKNFTHKLFSLLFLSSGSTTYVPTKVNHILFNIFKFSKILHERKLKRYWDYRMSLDKSLNFLGFIDLETFLIHHMPRNKPICLIEFLPGMGIKYVRSPGCFAIMHRKDYRLNTGLIKLPSGVRKIVSSYSLASVGENPLSINKKCLINKAGYYSNFGIKPLVRGVAMNPVDHPHGGRTKTVRWPRTPWGKTTKFK